MFPGPAPHRASSDVLYRPILQQTWYRLTSTAPPIHRDCDDTGYWLPTQMRLLWLPTLPSPMWRRSPNDAAGEEKTAHSLRIRGFCGCCGYILFGLILGRDCRTNMYVLLPFSPFYISTWGFFLFGEKKKRHFVLDKIIALTYVHGRLFFFFFFWLLTFEF